MMSYYNNEHQSEVLEGDIDHQRLRGKIRNGSISNDDPVQDLMLLYNSDTATATELNIVRMKNKEPNLSFRDTTKPSIPPSPPSTNPPRSTDRPITSAEELQSTHKDVNEYSNNNENSNSKQNNQKLLFITNSASAVKSRTKELCDRREEGIVVDIHSAFEAIALALRHKAEFFVHSSLFENNQLAFDADQVHSWFPDMVKVQDDLSDPSQSAAQSYQQCIKNLVVTGTANDNMQYKKYEFEHDV